MKHQERNSSPSRTLSRLQATALALLIAHSSAALGDGTDHMPDSGVDCLACHNLHDGGLIPTGLDLLIACQACHNPTGQAAAMSDIGLHTTRNGTIDCGKCHNPHRAEVSNADNIRPFLRYATASTQCDYPDTTPRKYIEGVTLFNGVCEVCHTQTDYHRNSASADHLHNSDMACTDCHTHSSGFMPSCLGCHDKPQDNGDGIPLGGRRAVVPDDQGNPNDFGNTSHHVAGAVQESDCIACHYMADHQQGVVKLLDPDLGDQLVHIYTPSSPDLLAEFCINCHDADGALAGGGLQPFSDGRTVPDVAGTAGSTWEASAHNQIGYWRNGGSPLTCFGDGVTNGCHGNAHGSSNERLLSGAAGSSIDDTCFQCHTDGMIENKAMAGSVNDIEQAFSMSRTHSLGTSFTVGANTYSLQCTTCHNPHVVTGKHWNVDQGVSPVTRPDLTADPQLNPRAMGSVLWGAQPGEKMEDFAAQAAGSGGWYHSVARGGVISFDQPGVYQPMKAESWNGTTNRVYEFGADTLPDYTSLCLDCHSHAMSSSVYPINWGQGIPTNYDGNPTTWVTARAPHGLTSANQPNYGSDSGMWGSNGNDDPIFQQDWVTRGRGFGHFMRWPYESASRNAGANFVMSCTDCHESHGSNSGGMLRSQVNYGPGTTNWNTMCNNCHYYYGGQHAGMSCGYASCHEQQSIHRIKKNGEYSGATFLWQEPSRPGSTPEIDCVSGIAGSAELLVSFSAAVWGDTGLTESLAVEDFLLTDVGANNPRTILGVTHAPGDSFAWLTMSAPLELADVGVDLLATRGMCVWDAEGDPAGPWTVTIPSCPSASTFQMSEPAGSVTFVDDSGLIVGTVMDPTESFPGDGFFHGDMLDNRLLYDEAARCFKADRKMTIEFLMKTDVIDLDSGDPERSSTIQSIFERGGSYNLRIVRADWAVNSPMQAGQAFMMFKFRAKDNGGTANWKQARTSNAYPIQSGRWYRIKLTFDSDIVGDIPIDIFMDDLGPDGDDIGEAWAGYVNGTMAQQPDDFYKPFEGDEIFDIDGPVGIGAYAVTANFPFSGLIDWIRWERAVY